MYGQDYEYELYHYGVRGMRWGVRRATKRLSKATTDDKRKSAVASLEKHRTKGSAEIEKLQKKEAKLQAEVDRSAVKYDVKAAKFSTKAAKARKKMGGRFVSARKAERLYMRSKALDAKASVLREKSSTAKVKIQANKTMQEAFKREIKNIDKALVDRGREYLNGD